MTTTIALAGKGGTGKTTVAAILVKYLVNRKAGSILAIDADPSANLNLALGLPLEQTIGDIREDMLAKVNPTDGQIKTSPRMTKFDYLDYEIEYALVEGRQVDLLAKGRPEGPGCYCAVNHILCDIIDRLGRSYDYVVIDNEDGMEHLSRRTTRDVDALYVVIDPTVRGVVAAGRTLKLGVLRCACQLAGRSELLISTTHHHSYVHHRWEHSHHLTPRQKSQKGVNNGHGELEKGSTVVIAPDGRLSAELQSKIRVRTRWNPGDRAGAPGRS